MSILIGIVGKKGHGKSTIGEYLQDRYSFKVMGFADPLKEAAKLIYHLDNRQVYGSQIDKETPDPRWDGLTPREILQRLGTDVARQIHPETWIRSTMMRVIDRRVVITDVRFLNEAAAIRARHGLILRVIRSEYADSGIGASHASEIEQEQIEADCEIQNDGSIYDLCKAVDVMLKMRFDW